MIPSLSTEKIKKENDYSRNDEKKKENITEASKIICGLLLAELLREMMSTGEFLQVTQKRLLKAPHIYEAVKWLSENTAYTTDAHKQWIKIFNQEHKLKECKSGRGNLGRKRGRTV